MELRARRQKDDTIRLDSEGNWYQGEYPILHERTVQYFYKNIAYDEDANYFLTGEDKPVFIDVEDVAFWINKLEKTIAGYLITLTDGTIELLNPQTLWMGKKNALYCLVKGGHIPARFFRGPFFEIMAGLETEKGKYFLTIARKKCEIARTPPADALFPGKKKKHADKKKKKKLIERHKRAQQRKKIKKKIRTKKHKSPAKKSVRKKHRK